MSKPAKRVAKGKAAPKKKPAVKAGQKAGVAAKAAVQPEAVAAGPVPAPESDVFYLTLDAGCTLRDTADMQFSLVAANGDPVVVDGAAVQRIDTAGLQLLVALSRRQQAAGRRLEWKAASPELLDCSRQLGLVDVLGLAALANGEGA